MAIIILNRFHRFAGHYPEWLHDYAGSIHFLTSANTAAQYPEFERKRVYPRLKDNPQIELDVVDIARHEPIDAIIALDETEILRAAQLREHLGIPGQSVASARAYRDKLEMKRLLQAGGVEVPTFAEARSTLDLLSFAERTGFPVVVKPVNGLASSGVRVLRDKAELRAYIADTPYTETLHLDVESFVPGDMYHVDGLFDTGRVLFASVGRYLSGCLDFQGSGAVKYTLLPPEDPRSVRISALIQDVIAALPSTPFSSFHAEVFLTPDDRLVVCEIGSRTGGARLDEAVRSAYGVDLNGLKVRHDARLPVPEHFDPPLRALTGGVLIRPRTGALVTLPAELPFPWVIDYVPGAVPGRVYDEPKHSVDCIATILVEGRSPAEVEARLATVETWFAAHTHWAPVEPRSAGPAHPAAAHGSA